MRPVNVMMYRSNAIRCASLLLLFGCACPSSSKDASEDKPPAPRADVPPPAKEAEPPALDLEACDRALEHARKCVNDSPFDSDVKAKLVATVVHFSDLWALRSGMPPQGQHEQCRRILDGLAPVIRQTGCPDLPETQRTIEP